jgi:hypothetical protein
MAKYGSGDRVTQAQYGDGTVIKADTYHTTIDFDDHGVRTFASERVVLVQATSVAPVRTRKRAPSRRRTTTTPA